MILCPPPPPPFFLGGGGGVGGWWEWGVILIELLVLTQTTLQLCTVIMCSSWPKERATARKGILSICVLRLTGPLWLTLGLLHTTRCTPALATTEPPLLSMRSFSSGLSGLWSCHRNQCVTKMCDRLCLDWELPKKSRCHQDVRDRLCLDWTAKEITVSPRCVRQTVPRLRAAKEITVSPRCVRQTVPRLSCQRNHCVTKMCETDSA